MRLLLRSTSLVMALLTSLFDGQPAWAACPGVQSAGTDCVAGSANKDITAFTTCKNVANALASGKSLMVPIGSSTDWSRFYANPPTGVTIGNCASSVTVTSITPTAGLAVGGATDITVTGTGFVTGLTVKINGVNCTSSGFTNATTATCRVPDASAGTIDQVDVTVTNADASTGTLTDGFFYVGAPTSWLKADAGLTIGGGKVTAWADQSGNGNHLAAYGGSTSKNPTTANSASFNNKPVVTFSGGQVLDWEPSKSTFRNISAASVVFVARPTSLGNNQGLIVYTRPSDAICRFCLYININTTIGSNVGSNASGNYFFVGKRLDAPAPQHLIGGTLTLNTAFYSTVIIDYVATAVNFYVNGTLGSSSTSFQTTGSTQNTDSENVMFGAHDDFEHFNGDIAETMIYTLALTATQRGVLETYIRQKYAFP